MKPSSGTVSRGEKLLQSLGYYSYSVHDGFSVSTTLDEARSSRCNSSKRARFTGDVIADSVEAGSYMDERSMRTNHVTGARLGSVINTPTKPRWTP